MNEHALSHAHVTRFRGAAAVEVASRCACGPGGVDVWIYGRGRSLAECAADLKTKFNEHSEAS